MKRCVQLMLLLCPAIVVWAQSDMESSYESLKAAVDGKKDPDQIKKLAADTYAAAQKASSSDAARAKEVEEYADYALYDAAATAQPAKAAELLGALEQQDPKSKYLNDGGYWRWFAALRQSNQASKIPAIAAKALPNFPDNTDLLYELAVSASAGQHNDQAVNYSNRLIAAIGKHPKPPAGTPQAEWDRKLDSELGTAHLIVGVVDAQKNQFYQADKELRAALPLIKDNEGGTQSAYFYLGLSNYQLGTTTLNKAQVLQAVKFSQQAAGMKGPLTAQAAQNAQAMKAAADKMR